MPDLIRTLIVSLGLFAVVSFGIPRPARAELPVSFDPGKRDPATGDIRETGPNVRWAVSIGAPTYATPVVSGGKVLIGTLNNTVYDPARAGSRSVLYCFDDRDGNLLWQLAMPKNYTLPYFDSFCVGISSTPRIVGDRAYLTANSGEVLCLDMKGLADGNDGPFRDEAALFAFKREPSPPPLGSTDADVIWLFNMHETYKCRPHDTNNTDILVHDGLLYVKTGNAPDNTHVHLPNPEAPSLLVLDMETGEPLARDDFDIGCDISHGQWCNPTLVRRDGKTYILYGGGNASVYCVAALSKAELRKISDAAKPKGHALHTNDSLPRLATLWKFRGDPRAQPGSGEPVPPYIMGMGSPSYTCLPPPRYDEATETVLMIFGHDAWNGARPFRSWLAAFAFPPDEKGTPLSRAPIFVAPGTEPPSRDALDITRTALRWGTPNIEGGAITPPALGEGLLYFGDRKGKFYCYDVVTGRQEWTLQLRGDIWAAPLLAEGKIYVGTDRRMFYTLRAGRKPEILAEMMLPDRVFAPAAAHGKTLYVAGDGFLYAVEGE